MATEIIHLHSDASRKDISSEIISGLLRPAGQKHLPTVLLYDERGLRLYDDITTKAPEYYLFGAEEEILKNHADEIVRIMHHGVEEITEDEVVLEFGAGWVFRVEDLLDTQALRKTSHILLGLSRLVPNETTHAPIIYYALDLEERELIRTLSQITSSDIGSSLKGKVKTKGMLGTYDDGLKFVQEGGLYVDISSARPSSMELSDLRALSSSPMSNVSSMSSRTDLDTSPPSTPDDVQPPLHILFLGSSLGNFTRTASADFLRSLPLRPGSGDTLLLGLDHDNSKQVIENAYNDPAGHTKVFIMNGLKAAGRVLGDENMFDEGKWEYVNNYNVEKRQHEACYRSKHAQIIPDHSSKNNFVFLANELLKIEESFKFSETDSFILFAESNLRPIQRWTDSAGQYSLWLLERPPFHFPILKSPTVSYTPSIQDWQAVWRLWDCITRNMIPPSMLYQKPIDLRHICLFYCGHIPVFLDIHLSRLLDEPNSEPEGFKYIFERGIDPNVDDPSECHPHSEVPQKDEDWPSLTSILQFQSRARARVLKLYDDIDNGTRTMNRKIARVLFMTLEHEALHAETLLYMLIQRSGSGTLPPPGFTPPPWSSLAATWNSAPLPKSETVTLGPGTVIIGHDDAEADDINSATAFDVAGHEFGWDNEHPKREVHVDQFMIEWRPVTNRQFYEFYLGAGNGKVQLPASWVEKNGRIQVRTLYGPVPMQIAENWPVVTSYDNLSTYAIAKGGRIPTEPELRLFYEKFDVGYEGGANLGFRNWHPVPATTGRERNGGKGSNGGVWEWTSTIFDRYDGFIPSTLYPAYSTDFFDDAHQVVIGGSYATIPRIAKRRSVRNWYQRKYPYAWVGARVAYDIQ